MTFARRRRNRRTVTLGLALWLGFSFPPQGAGASQHMLFDRLTPGDIDLSRSVLQDVLETHRSQQMRLWRNDATGVSGSVMPLRTFKIKSGHYCRDYRETVVADGTMDSRDGTACRTDGGLWVRIEN
jgi:surface antigen